jgi:hypothetical protein
MQLISTRRPLRFNIQPEANPNNFSGPLDTDGDEISDEAIFEDSEATLITRRSIRNSAVIQIHSIVMRKLRIIFQGHLRQAPTLFFNLERLFTVGVVKRIVQSPERAHIQ